MQLTKRNLAGKEHLAAVTDLLQRIRLEDAFAGLYDAAEVQWWWRTDDAALPERQTYWCDATGQTIACLLLHDSGDEWNNDFIYLPSARQVVEAVILPEAVATLSNPGAGASPTDSPIKDSSITVRADDDVLQQRLTAAGFVADDSGMVQFELVDTPPLTPLPPGFTLTSRTGDAQPHHMIRRNRPNVAEKLAECSLYRPDLDLCMRDAAGTVAAYALFWMDERTRFGVLEPLRTEANFQRLGLARHLIAEGVARLQKAGATSIRVTTGLNNAAAAKLYRSSGFADRFQCVEYRRGVRMRDEG